MVIRALPPHTPPVADGDVREQHGEAPADAAAELARVKSGGRPDEGAPAARPPWILVPVLLALSGTVAWLLLGGDDPFVYSETVTNVTTNAATLGDRELRVEGALAEGSVRFREDPCEWRFTLEEDGHTMPVEFSECVVPDTFRDHMGITVVVEGRVRPDGTFIASDVIPRCPSRYEMDERAANGETMPHAPGGPIPAP